MLSQVHNVSQTNPSALNLKIKEFVIFCDYSSDWLDTGQLQKEMGK